MLSFQWFPIKEHMFWLFSIFQLVFHLASIGFFMFFFFPFFCSQVLKLCTYLASQPAATRVSKRISLVQDLDEEQLRLGWWEIWLRWNGRPVFLQRTTVVSCFFFWTRKKRQKEGLEMVTYVLAFSGIGFSGKINGDHQRSGGLGAFLLFWLEGGMAGRPIMIMGTSGDSQPAQT